MTDNFVKTVENGTEKEIYSIMFDIGNQKIDIDGTKEIVLDFLHDDFRKEFTRVGNDLIIGSNAYHVIAEVCGTGFGKEVWEVSKTDEGYSITKNLYAWQGSDRGYSDEVKSSETITMTEDEFVDFQQKQNVTLQEGQNTLYTTWPVIPNPHKYYHMEDMGRYSPYNGKVILSNYFKYYKNDNVYIGDTSLKDIISEKPYYKQLFKSKYAKSYNVYDTYRSDNLFGGDNADKITSLYNDDMIDAGKGNDKIYLGKGNKEIVISQGDGKDTIYNFYKSDSVKFNFDETDIDNLTYTKSGNNLVINREYDGKKEQTIINNYFKNYGKDNNIIISQGDVNLVEDLTKALIEGDEHLTINTKSKTVKGTSLSDEAFSSKKNEVFKLGKGNDVIRFQSNSGFGMYPYKFGKDTVHLTKGEHLTLDIQEGYGTRIYCTKKGNDAVLTVRYKVEIAGRDFGKEEWSIKKGPNNTYQITKVEYRFNGNGYVKGLADSTTDTLTKSEFQDLQKDMGVKLKVGKNTLYTSWAVIPSPNKSYSKKDCADYGEFLGSVTLKNYFKYNEDNVYIGDKSLSEYFDNPNSVNNGVSLQYIDEVNQSLSAWQNVFDNQIVNSMPVDEVNIQPILTPVENIDIN